MSKPTLIVFPEMLKAHVAGYTRSDGVFVKEHDDKRQAAVPKPMGEPINHGVLNKLKASHKTGAAGLKSDLSSALSEGDTESEDGSHLTYGDVKKHLHTMRTQLGKDPAHAQHIEHAGYAVQQAFRHDTKPLEEKHAKLIGAALSGKTRIDDNGMVQHAKPTGRATLAKAHIDQYVRKDGTVVQAHDDKRQAAVPKPAAGTSSKPGWDSPGWTHQNDAVNHLNSSGASGVQTRSESIEFNHGGKAKSVKMHWADDGHRFVKTDELHSAVGSGDKASAPKPGEVGHHEHTEYGAYFHPGDKVKDQTGKTHEVAEHRGASVRTKGGEIFHPTKLKHAGEPRLALPVKKGASQAKTGSAAPARMTNVGSEKYPLLAKTSGELPAKHADGSTHHVGGFEPPSNGKGDHMVQHDRKTFLFTGKSGKNIKTGEASYEYAHKGDAGERRAWVTHSGHLMND